MGITAVQVTTAQLLIRPLTRIVGWYALLCSVVLAFVIVWWLGQVTTDVVLPLRLGALCLAVGMSFVLDDPTAESTSMTPVSVLMRRLVRIALTLPVVVVACLLLTGVANGSPASDMEVSPWPFLVEFFAYCSAALAGATVGGRHLGDQAGGIAGAGAVTLVALVAALLPGWMRLWDQMPGTAGYGGTTKWWWTIVVAGGLVLTHYSRVGAPSLRSWGRRPGDPSKSTP